MKVLRFLLFILLIIFSFQGDYSINDMIKYLRSSGYYDLLLAIKNSFGRDTAINCCKECANSYKSRCPEAVNNYIINPNNGNGIQSVSSAEVSGTIYSKTLNEIKRDFNNLLNNINATENFKNLIKNLYSDANNKGKVIIIENLKIYKILRQRKSEVYILKYIQSLLNMKSLLNKGVKI